LLVAVALTAACGATAPSTTQPSTSAPSTSSPSTTQAEWQGPPPGRPFDYQLAGDYSPAPEVEVLTRDWFAGTPDPQRYNICYVNAFQTQPPDDADRPDERDGWPADVVLAVEDPQWPGEFVIDLSTPERRSAAAAHVELMLDICASKGFAAVEFDNLDTYSRFQGLPFGIDEAVDFAARLADGAHQRGLAVGQKNTVELTRQQSIDIIGFDFVVVEQCAEFDECATYRSVFGVNVFSIEYTDAGMVAACEQFGEGIAVVRRDLNLTTPDDPSYRYDSSCGPAATG